MWFFFFFQAEDGIRDVAVTGVRRCSSDLTAELVLAGALLPGCREEARRRAQARRWSRAGPRLGREPGGVRPARPVRRAGGNPLQRAGGAARQDRKSVV